MAPRRLLLRYTAPLVALLLLLLCSCTAAEAPAPAPAPPATPAEEKKEEIKELPAVAGGAAGTDAVQLKLGEKLALESMGPLVINKDGTTKRVTNWDKMTEGEKETAVRRIKARNRERIQALKDQQLATGEIVDPHDLALNEEEL